MKTTKPDPKTIKNFPLDNPKAGIVCERGNLYVCERQHFWNPETKKKSESRLYIGRIVDGVYYSMEQYRRKFKRDGSLRTIERHKARPYHRKTEESNQKPYLSECLSRSTKQSWRQKWGILWNSAIT